jgi:Flp pilus assembly protein TadD
MYQGEWDSWVTDMSARGNWPVSSWDWLECEIYGREARGLLGVDPVDDPRMHMLRARAFAGLRRSDDAEKEYAIALKLSPGDPQIRLEYHRNRAYVLVAQQELVAAAHAFAKATEIAPDDSDLWRFEAYALSGAGDLAGYRRVCRDMLARFKNTRERTVAYDVVDACVIRADAVEDISALMSLAELGAQWYVGGARMLGAACCRTGRFADAVRHYQQVAELTPLRARDWLYLSMAHHGLGRVDDARQCLDRAKRWIATAKPQRLHDLSGDQPVWGGWYEPIDVPMLYTEVERRLQAGR